MKGGEAYLKIGEKIKMLRIRNNLTQEELAERSELTKGFISQVERDLASPSIATFVDILDALGTDLKEFFTDPSDKKIVFTENEFFESHNDTFGYTINWVIPNAQKNRMEPVLLTLPMGARSKSYGPHESEEFGYVLSGTVILHMGEDSYTVRRGQTFYLTGEQIHYLENTHKTTANVLWVSGPPVF